MASFLLIFLVVMATFAVVRVEGTAKGAVPLDTLTFDKVFLELFCLPCTPYPGNGSTSCTKSKYSIFNRGKIYDNYFYEEKKSLIETIPNILIGNVLVFPVTIISFTGFKKKQ